MRWGPVAVSTVGLAGVAVGSALVAARRRSPATEPDTSGMPAAVSPSPPRGSVRVSGEARVLAPSWEPVVATALARWEPTPPATGMGRVAVSVWAAPLTMVGLVVGALSGVRPRIREGVVVFDEARGLPAAAMAWRGFTASAIGHVVIARRLPRHVLAHELVHVRQAERFGAGLPPLYLALLMVYGYARHPLERAARRAGRRALDAPI